MEHSNLIGPFDLKLQGASYGLAYIRLICEQRIVSYEIDSSFSISCHHKWFRNSVKRPAIKEVVEWLKNVGSAIPQNKTRTEGEPRQGNFLDTVGSSGSAYVGPTRDRGATVDGAGGRRFERVRFMEGVLSSLLTISSFSTLSVLRSFHAMLLLLTTLSHCRRHQTTTIYNHSLSLVVIVILLLSCYARAACNEMDQASLASLSLNISNLNWPSSGDCCSWEGVECDGNDRVTRLWLPRRGLRGLISPSFSSLTQLTQINLSHNCLSGPLPYGFFSSFTTLQIVDFVNHDIHYGSFS
ncbi:hypothetical protein LguiB_021288 [Lonicera macranthoides]